MPPAHKAARQRQSGNRGRIIWAEVRAIRDFRSSRVGHDRATLRGPEGGPTMTAVEFLEYLHDHDATEELAGILADVVRQRQVAALARATAQLTMQRAAS